MKRKRRLKTPNKGVSSPACGAEEYAPLPEAPDHEGHSPKGPSLGWLTEIRRIHREGVEQVEGCEIPKRRFKDLAEGVDALLAVMERLLRGEITAEQSLLEAERFGARWPVLRPNWLPAWLPPKFAWDLLNLVRAAQEKHPHAPQELQEWLNRAFAKPRGRPTDATLTLPYQKAAQLRRRGLSWMRITRKLCPSRSMEGHRCTKACVDKIRMGVREYET